MKQDWKKVIGAVAPMLATALGGPLGGRAATVAGRVLFGDKAGSTFDSEIIIDALMSSQSPDVFLKLKLAEKELVERLKEMEVEIAKVDASDRNPARQREIAVKGMANANLAGIAVIGFFGVLGGMFFLPIPEESVSALDIMLGGLIVMVGKVYNYYFGSSQGSSDKNDIIAGLKQR